MAICVECKQPILDGAKRCHHCTAPQNWVRFIANGSLLTGLILALISIGAAQPIQKVFEEERAEINVSILEGDETHTLFMVSNTGNRPAGLVQIEIQSELKEGQATWYLRSDLDKKLFEPGKAYVLDASNGSLIPAVIPQEIRPILYEKGLYKENCSLVLAYVQMSGVKEFLHYPFPCTHADPRSPISGPQ